MIHWQVKFKSLRADELYTVNIYDDNYYGQPIQLTGAAQPFVTQEANPDDMFATVLTQSGYLRIVDTGKDGAGNPFDWRDFIPNTDIDRPVTLTNGIGDTVWMGFLQAQNFGSAMFQLPQERDFPVQCPLTIISRSEISMADTEIHNFAYLLLEIVDNIPYVCRPNMFYFQGLNATDFLRKKLDWQNFVKIDDNEALGQYDLFQLLQELCKFWGWTARIHHDAMYFVSADVADNYLIEARYSDLQDIAYETSFFVQDIAYTNVVFGNDVFASTSNVDFQMRGPNTAKITAHSGDADSPVISLYPDSVLEQMESGSSYQEQYGTKRAFFSDDITEFESPLMIGSCASSTESFNIMDISEGSGFVPQGETKSTFNTIRIRQTYSGNVLVSLETVFEHTFNGLQGLFTYGGIAITGNIYRQGERYEYADGTTGAGLSHLQFRVGIGSNRSTALWSNGTSTWQSTPITFGVAIGGTQRQGFLWAARTNDPDLKGRLFVDILGSDDMRHEASTGYIDRMEIVDLTVTFVRANDNQKDSSHEYVAHNDNMVKEERTDETIFATDNNLKYGYALLMNPDGTMFKGIDYNGDNTLVPPEQYLANRIVGYWSTSKRKMEVELLANKTMETGTYSSEQIVDLSPGMKATLDGTAVYPISISHNWRDDTLQVVMLELGNYTPPQPGPTPPPSRLPDGYTELAYISTADASGPYINTGLSAGSSTRILAQYKLANTGFTFPFSVRDTATAGSGFGVGVNGSQQFISDYGGNRKTFTGITPNMTDVITVDKNKNVCTITIGNQSATVTNTASTFTTTNKLVIFGQNSRGTVSAWYYTFYSFKMWNNDTLVRDLVPAMRDSDSEVGMYDLVGNSFLTNAGTGTFSYGTL